MSHTPEPWTTQVTIKEFIPIACVNGCAGLTEEEICAAVSQFRVRQPLSTEYQRLLIVHRECVEALKAITARINGEFDNPALEPYGILELDSLEGIKRITEQALAHATEQP